MAGAGRRLCGRGGGRASSAAFARVSLEKLLWTSIFWMLCAASGPGVTVGDVVDSEPELVRALAAELTDVIATAAPTHRAEFERGCLDAVDDANGRASAELDELFGRQGPGHLARGLAKQALRHTPLGNVCGREPSAHVESARRRGARHGRLRWPQGQEHSHMGRRRA